MESSDLVRRMNGVAHILKGASDLDGTLTAIAESAVTVPGTEDYALTVTHDGDGRHLARISDLVAAKVETVQDELDQGPALDALRDSATVHAPDLACDGRWPEAGPAIVEAGYRSLICLPLMGEHTPLATLTLLSSQPNAFTDDDLTVAELMGSRAAAALSFAATMESLSSALDTRSSIGVAVGIVMERYALDRDRAFRFLVRLSQNGNTKLRDVAEKLIDSQTPVDDD